jgi:predicted ATPase
MPFTVVPPRGPIRAQGTPFILRRDNWNDFGFQTLYQLYSALDPGEPTLIGDVKILRRGQTPSDGHQLTDGPLIELDARFCSIGQSLDYYERLAGLSPDVRDTALRGLRDIVRFPEFGEGFHSEDGWSTSLFRSVSEGSEFIQLARVLLDRDYSALPAIALEFQLELTGWSSTLVFGFDAPELPSLDFFHSPELLPKRIAVIIGRNGSGKSTLLARLARIAHASRWERGTRSLQSLGRLIPEGIGFTRILTISYSAFDTFQVPGVTRRDREQIAHDIQAGTGRYIFCGLRDIAQELEAQLAEKPGEDDTDQAITEVELQDRQERTLLKSLEQIAAEFVRTLSQIERKNRVGILRDALAPILNDPSFNDLPERTITSLLGPDRRQAFMGRSTGHKIVLHVITSLVAYAERKSLVLFDEPEAHLHPPLLAALMHGVRLILEKNDAFAIIGTHSPVVLQESLARHVHVIRREGDLTTIRRPSIQTFAENIGTITSEIFELTGNITDYHSILAQIAARSDTIEQIEQLFDGSLSMQGRAFVMSQLVKRAS